MNPPFPILYGIANCTTVKKARSWLHDRGIHAHFHDFKKQGVPTDRLTVWISVTAWQTLLNRQGTTWRKLDAQERTRAQDAASAATLMIEHPSLIKRPVVEWDDGYVTVGFDVNVWSQRIEVISTS